LFDSFHESWHEIVIVKRTDKFNQNYITLIRACKISKVDLNGNLFTGLY